MRRAPVLLLAAALLTACGGPPTSRPSAVTIGVTSLRPLPAARAGDAAAKIGNVIWVAGGRNPRGVATSTLWAYQPGRGVVRTVALPFTTADEALVARGPSLFLLGGGGDRPRRTLGQVVLPRGTYTSAGALPTPLSGLWAGLLGGHLTTLGGFDGKHSVTASHQFEGGRWKNIVLMPYGIRFPAVAEAHGILYEAGGLTTGEAGQGGPNSGVFSLNASGSLTSLGSLPVALYGASAARVGGSLYVIGGETTRGYLDTIYRFDLESREATLVGHLPEKWAQGAAVQVGNSLYVLGGENATGPLRTVWKLTIRRAASG